MAWKTFADIKPPQQADFPTLGDFILAYTVYGDLENAESKFLAATPDPQYASPQAYIAALVQNAFDLPKFSSAFATPNPIASGVKAAMNCIAMLAQLPVSAGDPNSVSILAAWENGTGQLYGGHAPIPAPGANSGVSAGAPQPGAGPVSVLGQPQQTGGSVSIFGQPE